MTIIEAQAEAWRLGFTTLLVQFAPQPIDQVRIMWRACRGSPGRLLREWAGCLDVPPRDVEKYLPMVLDSMITMLEKWVEENVPEPEVIS